MQTADRSLPTQYHFCNDPQTNSLRYGCNRPEITRYNPTIEFVFRKARNETTQRLELGRRTELPWK
jgi:hypothetical protein